MWQRPWPPKKAKIPPVRTARNLSNLHVIETNVTHSKSFKDISCTESLYPQERFSNLMQKSPSTIKSSSQPSNSQFHSQKPSKLSMSSKLKRKYYYNQDRYDYYSSHFVSDQNDSHRHHENVTVNNKNSNFPRKNFHKPNYYQRYSKALKNKRRRQRRNNLKTSSSVTEEENTLQKSDAAPSQNSDADELNESQYKVQTSDMNEDCFEEVEVASYEAEVQHEVPVSFRKTKVHYLKYKKKCFYKPKIYNIAQQRITVSCLNSTKATAMDSTEGKDDQDDQDEIDDIDHEIIDIADDDSNETVVAEDSDQNEVTDSSISKEVKENSSQNQVTEGTIQNEVAKANMEDEIIKDIENEVMKGSIENEVMKGSIENEVMKGSIQKEVVKESIQKEVIKESIQKEVIKESIQKEVTERVVQKEVIGTSSTKDSIQIEERKDSVQTEITEDSVEEVVADSVHNESQTVKGDGKVNKTAKAISHIKKTSTQSEKVIEVIELDDDEEIDSNAEDLCKSSMEKNKMSSPTVSRVYKKCADKSSIYQGKSLIQTSLDSWKSHLIGMEYLVEVQDTSNSSILNHYCILCSEDLPFGKFKSIAVLNHINAYSHIVKYLEMHFPTYLFRENKGYDNVVTLQKVCEAISRANGYYYMCITNLDQYVQCKETLMSILDSEKLSEKLANIDDTFLKQTFESVFLDEVRSIVSVILDKISQKEVAADKNKLKALVTKKETTLSSFLKLKSYSDFRKHFKGNKAKAASAVSSRLKKARATPSPIKVSGIASTKSVSDEVADAKSSLPALQVLSEKKMDGDQSIEILSEPSVVLSEDSLKDEPKVMKQKVVSKVKEKSSLKPGLHSKHCPKRILKKENSRLTDKTSVNNELTNDVPLKIGPKHKHVVKSSNISVVNKGVYEKKNLHKKDFKKSTIKVFDSKHKPVHIGKIYPLKHASSFDSSEATSPYRKVNIKVKSPPNIEILNESPRKVSTRSDTSPRKCSTSPYKRIVRRVSKSPARRIITSPLRLSPTKRIKSPLRVSPTRRITSPLRLSSIRRRSKSPFRIRPMFPEKVYSRNSGRRIRSPFKRNIRSPMRNPVRRQSRSPVRKRSRSPVRRYSRSPTRRHSRSPGKRHSRSPGRRHSRSPARRYSRSPARRYSRSPARRYSRSPGRRRIRSPLRSYAKSPGRRHSRSPLRRHSKSPHRRLSRSPHRRRSRSSERLYSRSPVGRKSRSPYDRDSRSSLGRRSSSGHSITPSDRHSSTLEKYKNTFRAVSPSYDVMQKGSRDICGQYSHSKSPQHISETHSSRYDSSKHKVSAGSSLSPSGISENFIPFLNSLSSLDVDLDPVSDEDESNYFSTSDERHGSDSKLSSQKAILAEILKKFSTADVNPNDVTVNKFMQFMQAHSSEIQELMGSRSNAKMPSSSKPLNMQQQNSFLQQYLFQSLAGKRESVPSNVPFPPPDSNIATSFRQQPFMPNEPPPKFGHPPVIPGLDHVQSSPTQAKIFPPNLNVPPPNPFSFANQKPANPVLPPKPRVPSEIMFKDLKATVSKLFGPNSSARVQEAKSGFVSEPDPAKFHLSHPDAPSSSSVQKNVFNPLSQNINFNNQSIPGVREEIPQQYNRNQFFSGRIDVEQARPPTVPIPPPHAKVSFCDSPSGSVRGNIFPVVNRPQGTSSMSSQGPRSSVSDVKVSLAQRLASVLVKVGMIDVPAPLLQEMLMKIGAFSSSPPQDITEHEILTILKRLGYL